MVVHVQITSLGLENCNSQHMIILLWNVYNNVMKLSCLLFTYKLESIYLALLSNLTIFSGQSSLIACLSMNQGDISALTSSGIFERRPGSSSPRCCFTFKLLVQAYVVEVEPNLVGIN